MYVLYVCTGMHVCVHEYACAYAWAPTALGVDRVRLPKELGQDTTGRAVGLVAPALYVYGYVHGHAYVHVYSAEPGATHPSKQGSLARKQRLAGGQL